MDAATILNHLPLKGVDLALLAALAWWGLPRLPASERAIQRRLAAIRDDDVREEARARLLQGSILFGPKYTNDNDLVTRRGLNLAVQHAETVVRRDRRLAPKRQAQQRSLRNR